jgi:uncharacterized protein YjbI with pentapeptide repeats
VVGYDGGQNVRDEELPLGRKDPNRKQSEETKQSRWGFRGMTVRDWLQLLIVPLALVVIGFLFTMQQDARQQQIEDQRAEAERELAEQRAQDEALQAYLDQMGSLLLEKDLRNSEKDSEVRTLARARTMTVIQRLDSDRNGQVIRFLNEAGLIGQGESSIRLLAEADLRGAHLRDVDLEGADLSWADLRDADLDGAYLGEAELYGALLRNADLHSANLNGADLSWSGLREADLSGAILVLADLGCATLFEADLSNARVTNEELGPALTLAGATMPNGQKVPKADPDRMVSQKYEDWLKSKGLPTIKAYNPKALREHCT